MASTAQLRQTSLPVSSHYGLRKLNGRDNFHKGTDFPFGRKVGVSSFGAGTVVFAGRRPAGHPDYERGMYVQVRHAPGIETSYHSLSLMTVEAGDRVEMGDIVGYGGKSAVGATGDHCHVGLWLNGAHVDLERLLAPGEVVTISNTGRVLAGAAESFDNAVIIPQEEDTMYPINWGGHKFTVGKQFIKHEINTPNAEFVKNVFASNDQFVEVGDEKMRAVCASLGIEPYALDQVLKGKGPGGGGRVWSRELEIILILRNEIPDASEQRVLFEDVLKTVKNTPVPKVK